VDLARKLGKAVREGDFTSKVYATVLRQTMAGTKVYFYFYYSLIIHAGNNQSQLGICTTWHSSKLP